MRTTASFFSRGTPQRVWGKILPSKIAPLNDGFLKTFLRHGDKPLAVATTFVAPALLLQARTVDTGNDLFLRKRMAFHTDASVRLPA